MHYDDLADEAIEEALAGFDLIDRLGGGARLGRVPDKGDLVRVEIPVEDLRLGSDVHDFGTIVGWEDDPHPRGRRGWVVFSDGSRTSTGAVVGVWRSPNR